MKTLVRHRKGEKKGQTELLDADAAKKLVDSKAAEEIDRDDETDEERKARKGASAKSAEDPDDDGDDDEKKALELAVSQIADTIEKKVNIAVSSQLGAFTKTLGTGLNIQVHDNRLDDRTNGFQNIGEFFHDVAMCRLKDNKSKKLQDYELLLKQYDLVQKADGMSESSTTLGGTLVPVEYSDNLYRDVVQESPLWGKSRKYPISQGRSIVIPVRNMTSYGSTASGGGSLGQWIGSADGSTIPPKAPAYTNKTLTLQKWAALLPITDELLEDNNVALSTFINEEGLIAMAYDMNAAFINGTGSGQPTGILQGVNSSTYYNTPTNTGTAIGVDRTTAGAIEYADLGNMTAHLWTVRPNDRKDVVWIAHPDAEAQFEQLKDSAGRNLYYAAGTIQQSPQARLLGIPVVYSYHCGAVGNEGDLILADLGQYFTATKQGGGVQTAMSIHLYFDKDETAFRITFRVDGQPARNTAMLIPNSANNRMGFVVLNYVGS